MCLTETYSRVRVGKNLSNVFPIRNGLKQSDAVSPLLFNFALEYAINTFAASYLNTQGLNDSFLKSPASTLVDLTFQSRTLRSFSLNQLRNLSL